MSPYSGQGHTSAVCATIILLLAFPARFSFAHSAPQMPLLTSPDLLLWRRMVCVCMRLPPSPAMHDLSSLPGPDPDPDLGLPELKPPFKALISAPIA